MAKLSTDWLDNYFSHGIDSRRRRIFFHGDVDEESVFRLVQSLVLLDDENKDEIVIYMSSLGGNMYEMEYRRYHDIKVVFDRHNVAGVCIHHDTKSREGDPIDRISGTRALAAAADALLVLQRPRGESDGQLYCTGREIEDSMREIHWCAETFQWTLGGELDPRVVNDEQTVHQGKLEAMPL